MIAAICRDGIIVASDSRGTFKDPSGRRLAYYDVNQKIFPFGDNLVADTGYASLNDPHTSFLSALMASFAHIPSSRANIAQLPASYFRYVDAVLPKSGAESAKIQTLVFAGFTEKRPLLCIYKGESTRDVTCQSSGYLSSPKQKISGLAKVGSLSFAEAASIMQKTIEDYAAAVQPGLVGGPVVVRTITPRRSEWLSDLPAWPRWESFSDLASDYAAGRVPFHLMPGIKRQELDTLIGQGSRWSATGAGPVSSASH